MTTNKFRAGLHINFTAEEVENFLARYGFEIKNIIGKGTCRYIIGNDGGGGIELSDYAYQPMEIQVAIAKDDYDFMGFPRVVIDEMTLDKYYHLQPDCLFIEILKNRLLTL